MSDLNSSILLISPPTYTSSSIAFGLPNLVSLAGFLKEKYDINVKILDLNFETADREELVNQVTTEGPYLLIGISCYSSFNFPYCMYLATGLRTALPDTPLIAGGYHASALPGDFTGLGTPFDAVVTGEGEVPLAEIVSDLSSGQGLSKKVYSGNSSNDLDTYPAYDWSPVSKYLELSRYTQGKVNIYLSRGCPFHCSFCMEQAKSTPSYRSLSVDRSIDEIKRLKALVNFRDKIINIADPIFGFNKEWRRDFLKKIIKEKLFPRQYWTLTRVSHLEAEDIKLLSEAKFAIGIGIESGDTRMLSLMHKAKDPLAYLAEIENFERLSREHGLNWGANFILGHPGETPESMENTYSFIKKLFSTDTYTTGWPSIDPFRLYPGSFVFNNQDEYVKKYGTVFYRPFWWQDRGNISFYAEYVSPSSELSYQERVKAMYMVYQDLLLSVEKRFTTRNQDAKDIYKNSIREQIDVLAPEKGKQLIRLMDLNSDT